MASAWACRRTACACTSGSSTPPRRLHGEALCAWLAGLYRKSILCACVTWDLNSERPQLVPNRSSCSFSVPPALQGAGQRQLGGASKPQHHHQQQRPALTKSTATGAAAAAAPAAAAAAGSGSSGMAAGCSGGSSGSHAATAGTAVRTTGACWSSLAARRSAAAPCFICSGSSNSGCRSRRANRHTDRRRPASCAHPDSATK